MSGLNGIRVEVNAGCSADTSTHNVLPLLHQLRHALAALIERDETTTIDLGALPLSPDDEQQIEAALGHGEITIQLDALGPSEIRETAFAGVWLVTHYNGDGDIMARFIEVTRVPAIVGADAHDIRQGLARLAGQLADDETVSGSNPHVTGD
jgi:hydrogenase-1 operon protein HyaF